MWAKKRLMALAGAALAASVLVFALTVWPRVSGLDPANPKVSLSDVEATVAQMYRVPEISHDALRGLSKDAVLFDVREADEFAQSHIAGARRIDPGMSAADFMAQHGTEVRGRTVVFYCAVGVRSALMLERVTAALPGLGANQAYNLRGGIFRWYAAGLPVRSEAGSVNSVHHYDAAWKKLLDRTVAAQPGNRPAP